MYSSFFGEKHIDNSCAVCAPSPWDSPVWISSDATSWFVVFASDSMIDGFSAVFARSAGPVLISGPVKDRLRPVLDRSQTPYVLGQSDQIWMLKIIQQSSIVGLSTIEELPAHISCYKSCKMCWNLGNFGGPVLGPVPNLGPVLVLWP